MLDRETRMSLLTTWVDRFIDTVVNSKPMAATMQDTVQALILYETMYGKLDVLSNCAEIRNSFSFKVTQTRANFLKLPLSEFAVTALSLFSESPGNVVMYLTVLKHLYAANVDKPKVITTSMLMDSLFEYKLPSNGALQDLWDAQKVEDNKFNLVDLIDPETDFILEN